MADRLFCLLIVTLLLSSCQSDYDSAGDDNVAAQPREIGIGAVRSGNFATPDEIWVWVGKDSDDDFAKAWHLTTTDGYNFSGTTRYWPGDGSKLSFKAVHGNFTPSPTENTTQWSGLTLAHSVKDNQTDDAARAKSDLLYAEASNVTSGTDVNLHFSHLLAKITFVMVRGEGLDITEDQLKEATVTFTGAKTETTFTASSLTTTATGSAATITMGKTDNLEREAIIPCQDAALTFTVSIPNCPTTGETKTINCHADSSRKFAQNSNTKYTLTLNNDKITLSSISVTDFGEKTEDKSFNIYVEP
ncbi:MAG: fimbrillin family protein [Prevotella sp.]